MKERKKYRITRIIIGILGIVLLISWIIFGLIFYLTKWYPNFITRMIIFYLFFEGLLRFTWFGKELDKWLKNKFKQLIKK